MNEPQSLDDVATALTNIGWGNIAAEWKSMQEVLARYADDEDRTLNGIGEPYGTISTETGIKARQHRASFRRRQEGNPLPPGWQSVDTVPENGSEFEYLCSDGKVRTGSLGHDLGGSVKRDSRMVAWRHPRKETL